MIFNSLPMENPKIIYLWLILGLLCLISSFAIAYQNYLVLAGLILIFITIASFRNYDLIMALFLLSIPYAWALATVGFYDSFDQKLSQFILYICIILTIIRQIGSKHKLIIKDNPLYWPLLAYLCANLIGVANSPDIFISIKEFIKISLFIIAYFLVFNYVIYQNNYNFLKYLLICVVLSVAFLDFLQVFADIKIFYPVRIDYYGPGHIDITSDFSTHFEWVSESGSWLTRTAAVYFGNPPGEAQFLMIGVFLTLTLALYSQRHKLLYYSTFFFISIALIMTQTRAAWLAVLASLALLGSKLIKKNKAKLLMLIVCVLALLFLFRGQFSTRLEGWESEGSVVSHLTLWEVALGAIKESPVLGIGLGVSKMKETMERLAMEYATDPNPVLYDSSKSILIHNYFLQTWTECGILGFASLIFIIWVYCKKTWRYLTNIEPNAEDKIICFGLFLSSIAMLLLNLTISFFDMEIWVIMAIALGIASKPELIKHSGLS